MTLKKVQLGAHATRAHSEPTTAKKEERTIEVVWTTGARGLRRGWEGNYYEELSLADGHVDLTRLKAGAQVLDTHDKWSGLRAIIGVVLDAWVVSPSEARALVRLSSDPDKQGTVNDILEGTIRNLSVGYTIRKLVEVGLENEIPVLRAEDWEPFELSFVPVPFDAGAQSRSDEDKTSECIVQTKQRDLNMPTAEEIEAKRLADEAKQAEAVRAASEAATAKTRTEEAERLRGISAIMTKHGLDNELAVRCFSEGKNLDQTREFVLDHLATKNQESGTRGVITAGEMDEKTNILRGAEEALLVRSAPSIYKPTEISNRFRGASIIDIVKDVLESSGVRTRGMTKNEIATRGFHTTSDFPLILGNSVKKILKDSYVTAPSDYTFMTRSLGLPDYKSLSRFGLSTGPALLEVKEHGEYKRGSFQEQSESMQLKKYGRVLAITREAIVNDDLGAFSDLPRMWAFSCAQLEANLAWAQITGNPTMGDGITLFHASHGNLLTASALDLANLELAVTALENQTGFSATGEDVQYMGLKAKYLIVAPALKYAAIKLTTSVDAIINSAVNPFSDLIVKSDPRLNGTPNAWYVAADASQGVDAIAMLHLNGEQGPQLEERHGFDVDGIEYKVRLDTGAKVLDHRWIVKNPGL